MKLVLLELFRGAEDAFTSAAVFQKIGISSPASTCSEEGHDYCWDIEQGCSRLEGKHYADPAELMRHFVTM
jgi:hypothetical protein